MDTAQKMKFFIKDFFRKCDQIRSNLRIWSHLLKKSLMENFIFCALWEKCFFWSVFPHIQIECKDLLCKFLVIIFVENLSEYRKYGQEKNLY